MEKKLTQQRTSVVQFLNQPDKIIAHLILAELTIRVAVDSHGIALWKPTERDVLPSDWARCPLVPACSKLPTMTGVASSGGDLDSWMPLGHEPNRLELEFKSICGNLKRLVTLSAV